MKGLFISGSGTNVGKTFIASHIIRVLNTKYHIVARKPIESDCIKTSGGGLLPRDAVLLNNACANSGPIDVVCRFKFEACVSSEKASMDQNLSITIQDLVKAVQPNSKDDFMVIEGAGGLYSPIAQQILNSDFAITINLPIVIVVKDELGAVNQALLSVEVAKKHKLNIVMLVLNQIMPNNLDNAKAISCYTDVDVVTFNKDKKSDFDAKILTLITALY